MWGKKVCKRYFYLKVYGNYIQFFKILKKLCFNRNAYIFSKMSVK